MSGKLSLAELIPKVDAAEEEDGEEETEEVGPEGEQERGMEGQGRFLSWGTPRPAGWPSGTSGWGWERRGPKSGPWLKSL